MPTAVCHSALRFDPFLSLAYYLDSDLDFSQKHLNNGGQAKAGCMELRCGGINADFGEKLYEREQEEAVATNFQIRKKILRNKP